MIAPTEESACGLTLGGFSQQRAEEEHGFVRSVDYGTIVGLR